MFSGKRRPGPGEGQALPVGGRASRSGRQARTTVYPCGTCLGPKHLVPYTPRASGTPQKKSSPIERTVPSQVHPAAQRRLSPTSLAPTQRPATTSTSPFAEASFAGASLARYGNYLTPVRPRSWPAAAPSNSRSNASPSPARLPAPPLDPRNATGQSAVAGAASKNIVPRETRMAAPVNCN